MRTTVVVAAFLMLQLSMGCTRIEERRVEQTLLNVSVQYSADGAGGCIPEILEAPGVKALLSAPSIWRVLIDCMARSAPTKSTFERESVPLGYLCLDILLKSVDEGHWAKVSHDFADDGLWASVRARYYFPPDVLRSPDGAARMRAVRQAWRKLYRESSGALFASRDE